jgi:pimeloyl-ACP methyl ester carboxylesterase
MSTVTGRLQVMHLVLLQIAARAAAAIALAAIAVMPHRALADASIPAASVRSTTSHQVIDYDWTDLSRSRAVPVRLYWPSKPDSGTAVPLVVFSHGIGGSRRGYSYLGQHLAGNGIACLHVQHVGSDRDVWFGNPFGMIGRLWSAANEREVVDRVRDLGFALDQLLEHTQFGQQLDRERIAAAGHSYGANTVMLVSGARLRRGGQTVELRDPRIKAALLISAPPFYGEENLAQILASLTLPSLHITATEDVIRIPGYYSPASDRLAVFDATGSPAKTLAVFEGGSHSMFTDRAGTGGAMLNPLIKSATKELALAFLRSVFDGKDDGMQQWPQHHSDLIARWVRRVP